LRPLIVTEYPPLRIELNGKTEDATGESYVNAYDVVVVTT